VPSGSSRGRGGGRRPVKTGDSKAVQELLGQGGPGGSDADDGFDLPAGYESRYAQDRRLRAAERQANAETNRATSPKLQRSQPSRRRAPARGARGGTRGRSGSLGIRRNARSASVLNPTGGRLPIGITPGSGAAGLFFGAITYALVLSVVEYGPTGPLLWFKAKFLNEPAAGPSSSTSSPPPAPAPAPTPSFVTPTPQTVPGTTRPVPTPPPRPTPGR
jgi:hypothetical protein